MQSENTSSSGGGNDATVALSPRLVHAALRDAAPAAAPAARPLTLAAAAGNVKAAIVPGPSKTEPSIAAIVASVAADLTAPVVATLAIRPSTPLASHPEMPRPPPVSATKAPEAPGAPMMKPSIENFPTPQRKSVLKLRASATAGPQSQVRPLASLHCCAHPLHRCPPRCRTWIRTC